MKSKEKESTSQLEQNRIEKNRMEWNRIEQNRIKLEQNRIIIFSTSIINLYIYMHVCDKNKYEIFFEDLDLLNNPTHRLVPSAGS